MHWFGRFLRSLPRNLAGKLFGGASYYKVCLKGPRLGSVRCGQGHGQRKLQLFRYGK